MTSSLLAGFFLVTMAAASTFGCGGSTTSGGGPGSASGKNGDSDSGWSGDEGGPNEPSGPNCDDGTCFLCGDGICPTGAYCDENAQGGAACAWLPECAKEPNCGCITGVLGANCSCDDSSGGPIVNCN